MVALSRLGKMSARSTQDCLSTIDNVQKFEADPAVSCAETDSLDNLCWWQTACVYQVLIQSFQDTDGDGKGDIRGVIERLDYFLALGVDVIWLSPIYESPMTDMG